MMDRLAQVARDVLNLSLTPAQLKAFERYAIELTEWNTHTNLTAITEPEAIVIRHFIDSLSCLLVLKPVQFPLRIVDVGSGGGFPGLPLKIVYPAIDLTLVESARKKIRFLEHTVGVLGVTGVSVLPDRAEKLGQMPDHREQYDWVLARAVASMPTLVEYLLPLCKVGGHCLPQKGETAHQEVIEAQVAIDLLGGQVVQLTQVELPTVAETRYLVNIRKIATTPPKYPRLPGMPAKRPLS